MKCCENCRYWRIDLDPGGDSEFLQCDFSFDETRYDDYCSAFKETESRELEEANTQYE
ncbi:MAG: hypothetical protein GX295_11840 [Syntrophomonadaceae bacterium]|nr:hypothetical protein [Syntrophomonadaceae bacterium]